jgi:hypothetical protein
MSDLHCYTACGLTLVSDAPIPGLCLASGRSQPDVTISMQGAATPVCDDPDYPCVWYVSPEVDPSGRPEMTIEAGEAGYRLAYSDIATFLVDRGGHRVVARWATSRTGADAAGYLAGSLLAFVLRVRGSLLLHASAVAVDGRALLFVGDAWSGKSSTAGAFSVLGYPLVSDDLVRIDARGGDFVAYPCQPRLNVWGDSAAVLFAAPHSDPHRKRSIDALDAGYRFQPTPVPIDVVYVLAQRVAGREYPGVGQLPPRQALIALTRHTYGGCYLDGVMRAREFEVVARFVERVPVRELTLGDSLQDLISSCRTLAEGLCPGRSPGPAPDTYE